MLDDGLRKEKYEVKKCIGYCFCVFLMLIMVGCTVAINPEATKLDREKPAEQQLQADITAALEEKNQNAQLLNSEVIKSLVGEGTYFISVSLSAETEYADWKYEADLYYTKYDQGWILDKVSWQVEHYEQIRTPEVEAMAAYAEDYLKNLDGNIAKIANKILPMEMPVMEKEFVEAKDKDAIKLSWIVTSHGTFGKMLTPYTSYWEYDAENDNWKLIEDKDNYYGYYEFDSGKWTVQVTEDILNFEGSWSDEISPFNVPVNVTIENFSYEGFDAVVSWTPYDRTNHEFLDEQKVTGYFKRVYGQKKPLGDNEDNHTYVFGNDKGQYITIQYTWSLATIMYLPDDTFDYSDIQVKIDKKLPSLP